MSAAQIALDLDGTLISCEQKQISVLRYAAAGIAPVDLRKAWESKRNGCNTANALKLLGVSEDAAKAITTRWEENVENPCWLSLDTVFSDVRDTLLRLRHQGFHLSLITARKRKHWLTQQLSWLGLRNELTSVTVVNPANSIFEKSVILSLIKPIVFIGDTESDGEAAKRSGIPFHAVSTGQRSREFLKSRGFESCFGSLSDALKASLL